MGIAQRSLVMFLGITAAVLLLVLLVTEYNIREGFAAYLAEAELKTIDAMPGLIAEELSAKGSWQELAKDQSLLERLFFENEQRHHPEIGPRMGRGELEFGPPPPPTPLPPGIEEGQEFRAPPLPPFRVDLLQRLAVCDQKGDLLCGAKEAKDARAALEIKSDGKTAGTLRLAPSKRINEDMERSFIVEQSRSLFLLCSVSFLLAGLSAYFFSRDLMQALAQVVSGTNNLIAGNWASRIEMQRKDELGRLATDINKLASTLQQYDRSHKQWLADTSHELRTPVAVLWAQVEALQDGIQEVNDKSLGVLHHEVQNLAEMIDDLHDLARYDAEDLKFDLLPCQPGKILQEIVLEQKSRFDKKGINVQVSGIEEMNSFICADKARLKQLFSRLLENSWRYTDTAGKLNLNCQDTGKEVLISFEDSEPGVPDEVLPFIFDRFRKAEGSRNRIQGGRGLGLAICKIISQGHGGSIRALKSPLGGLRIELCFPVAERQK